MKKKIIISTIIVFVVLIAVFTTIQVYLIPKVTASPGPACTVSDDLIVTGSLTVTELLTASKGISFVGTGGTAKDAAGLSGNKCRCYCPDGCYLSGVTQDGNGNNEKENIGCECRGFAPGTSCTPTMSCW